MLYDLVRAEPITTESSVVSFLTLRIQDAAHGAAYGVDDKVKVRPHAVCSDGLGTVAQKDSKRMLDKYI